MPASHHGRRAIAKVEGKRDGQEGQTLQRERAG
jgi:hypothetical protein